MRRALLLSILSIIWMNCRANVNSQESIQILQDWCGNWHATRLYDNKGHKIDYSFNLYSDYKFVYYYRSFDLRGGREVDYEARLYGDWTLVDNQLRFEINTGRSFCQVNSYKAKMDRSEIQYDANRIVYQITHQKEIRLNCFNRTDTTMVSIPGWDGVEVKYHRSNYNDGTSFYTAAPAPGCNFIIDTYNRPDCLIRGIYENADSTFIVGLFDRGLELVPIFGMSYTANGEPLEEIDKWNVKDKIQAAESPKIMELADKRRTPITGKGRYEFFDNTVYDGQWEDHLPHGHGKKTLANGEYFDGEWKEGKFIKGTVSIKQYDSIGPYEGEYSNGEPNGEGRLTRSDCVVVGRFTDGRPTGNMTVTFRDGCVFTGKISNGSDVDNGKMVYPDGSSFEGIWSKNDTWVSGKFTCLDQYYLDGFFSIDRQFSKGTYHDLKKQTELSGTWKANQLIDGHATIIPNDGSNIIQYDGDIADGSIKGEGTLVLNKGYSITAKWNNGQLWGDAVIKFDNGDSFAGRWINGELVKGTPVTYTWADGVECKCVAGNQSKVSKKKYYRNGVELKSKEAKLYQMMYTASEEKFQLSDDCQSLAGQLKITFTIPCNNH